MKLFVISGVQLQKVPTVMKAVFNSQRHSVMATDPDDIYLALSKNKER